MAKATSTRGNLDLQRILKTPKGESIAYAQVFETIGAAIPMAEGVVTTTLPRGSLQIAQPPRVSESVLKPYSKEFHAFDRPTWQAIARNCAVRGEDCWSGNGFEESRYLREFLAPSGFRHVAAAPLASPVMEGYPGAIQLFRTADQGDFSDAELKRLAEISRQLGEAIARTRSNRKSVPCGPDRKLKFEIADVRQFIFDHQLRPQLHQDLGVFDERLRQQMIQTARQRLEHVNGKSVVGDRVPLPDSFGDLWVFRVVVHKQYPALGDGPFVFFSLQPDCCDWGLLRPTDFQADAELARLIPALRFMEHEFHRGPTLNEIAGTVLLSPFHFHRRFTELLGITPKHFLLDCQIQEAKRQLLARKDLAEIAKSCGFAHQSHFTSRFKQATGLTPTRWRKLATERTKVNSN